MQTFKIYTLGCKVNQYESQAIRENLAKSGFIEIKNKQPADTFIINTCTVTEGADRDSLYLINKAFRQNKNAKVIVTGCLVEKDENKILAKFPGVQIMKNSQKNDIGRDAINRVSTILGITNFENHNRAFVKIQDGCNNCCSYCKVPLVRGRSRSRLIEDIVGEVNALVDNGFKEIVLSGICLGSFGKDLSPKKDLVSLLDKLEQIKKDFRIRLSSIEAKDVTKKLIKKIKSSPVICKHLHLPMQSGDDEILKKMNRPFKLESYLDLIKQIKKQIPLISITTDVIVGFPGETVKNFKNTVKAIKKIKPSRMHIFSYSDRPGTKAFSLYPKVKPFDIKSRYVELKNLEKTFSLSYRRKFLNKKVTILVEHSLDKKTGFQTGYTSRYIKVLIDSRDDLRKKLVDLEIKKVTKDFTLC